MRRDPSKRPEKKKQRNRENQRENSRKRLVASTQLAQCPPLSTRRSLLRAGETISSSRILLVTFVRNDLPSEIRVKQLQKNANDRLSFLLRVEDTDRAMYATTHFVGISLLLYVSLSSFWRCRHSVVISRRFSETTPSNP